MNLCGVAFDINFLFNFFWGRRNSWLLNYIYLIYKNSYGNSSNDAKERTIVEFNVYFPIFDVYYNSH